MNEHPIQRTFTTRTAAVAGGSDATVSVAVAPFDAVIESVSYIPDATITGADTNSRTISAINKGAAGAGTTEAASLALTNGVNATGFDEKALNLSGTAANLNVSEGDVIAIKSLHVGTGIADPGGLVKIVFTKR